ncbi:glycine cleavage system aminomethyltransferase GcvT [Bacillaceae bacterium Marseille-Q3522]|nr:glycine cleavage system aminomethyltransferase GcvT [Bacillaceae bacterium Marseille-Q3522]
MAELKHTALYTVYEKYGAKTVDFGGWELPVLFTSIKEEHVAVRTKAGLFDVSHMGEIEVKGTGSLAFLQKMVTNDVAKLKTGGAQYTAMCYEDGGTVDDLLIYRLGEDRFLLVVNAANIEKDYKWLKEHLTEEAVLTDLSEKTALLALQGPLAPAVLQKLTDFPLDSIHPFTFVDDLPIQESNTLVSRTGYTGEDGFEIYCSAQIAVSLWEAILAAGKEEGVIPCGLGARDTLRFEAKLPLYGQELSATISPVEAGIGFAVKVNKETAFIGQSVLKAQKENGTPRKIAGIEMIDRGIPRHGYPVYVGAEKAGVVTTGTQSPTLKKNVGLALLKTELTELGREVEVEIRGKRLKAKVVATPFYRR